MKILIDIGHPAHVHLFKKFALEMIGKGHDIYFTTREKESTSYLLNIYDFRFKSFGQNYKGKIKKIWGWAKFDYFLYKLARRIKPDLFLSHGSFYAAQVAWLLGKPHIALEDTGNMEQIYLYKPFTKAILTSDSFPPILGNRQIFYQGYHELFYLHPRRFTPDKSILNYLKLSENESFVIIRFVGWYASHDIGVKGLSYDKKVKAIKEFSKITKVFISAENELSEELLQYKINIPPEKMHDALAYTSLLFGESATMASECAMLGVPAIYLDRIGRYYTTDEEQKYGLVFNYSNSDIDSDRAINKGIEIILDLNSRAEWQKRRLKMLDDKIDVTALLIWFVENYPESFKIMKTDPDYQNKFK
jgi:predicted glycosyltransferase